MAKSNLYEADDEQLRYREMQTRCAKKSRVSNLILSIATLLLIYGLTAAFFIIPDKTMSEDENRTLQCFPEFTWERLLNGDWTSEFATYMADQFPLRDSFVGIKAIGETVQLKQENNGVMLARHGYLVTRFDEVNEKRLNQNLGALAELDRSCGEAGVPITIAVAGRTQDIADSVVSPLYGSYYSDELWSEVDASFKAEGVDYLNLRDPLRARFSAGEEVYYKTDHHWTSLGAYYAYEQIMKSFQSEAFPPDSFTPVTVSDEFHGTTWSTAGAKWTSDTMQYFRFDGDEDFTTTYYDGEKTGSFAGFYENEKLSTKDKYASFIGGNHSIVEVKKNEPSANRETLLVIKDSFAHSVAPFLARHYDLVIVDMRYYKQSVYRTYIAAGKVDRVLVLYNMDTLTTDTGVFMLGMR